MRWWEWGRFEGEVSKGGAVWKEGWREEPRITGVVWEDVALSV